MNYPSPPFASLRAASRAAQDRQVNQLDAGLRSIEGADTVISIIRNRRFVHRLIIGHNELGDEGCRRLFSFLCSEEGRKYDIQEISLNSNGIGDDGLLAISQYLKGNQHVRELFLQNNNLRGAPEVTSVFVEAINSSRLEILSVTTNKHLSDKFLTNFLPSLNAPHLHELQLSAVGLTSSSGKVIASYLASPECRLHVLKCNGNSLGLRGIKPIIRAIHNRNYTLRSIEIYANQLQDERTSSESVTSSDEEGSGSQKVVFARDNIQTWRSCEALLKKLILRNSHLKREVSKQAVVLLHYARPLLSLGQRRQELVDSKELPQPPPLINCLPRSNQTAFCTPFQFRSLPLELQHYILSFLAPSLSSSQRIRVIDYATSAKTLPLCFPPLATISRSVHADGGDGMTCIPDPSSIEYALGGTIWPIRSKSSPLMPSCSAGYCMGSSNTLFCRREKGRMEFLEVVGCDTFELDPGEGSRSARELFTLSLT